MSWEGNGWHISIGCDLSVYITACPEHGRGWNGQAEFVMSQATWRRLLDYYAGVVAKGYWIVGKQEDRNNRTAERAEFNSRSETGGKWTFVAHLSRYCYTGTNRSHRSESVMLANVVSTYDYLGVVRIPRKVFDKMVKWYDTDAH